MQETLLTPEQVAVQLQVNKLTVYEWLRKGQLRGLKLGRLWRVRPGDLETFLQASSNEPSWRAEFEALLARVRSRVPAEVTEEEILADAEAAVRRSRELIGARGR